MPKNTCELRVGRLLEIRVANGYRSAQDVDDMIRMIVENVAKLPPDVKHVTVADWRACRVLSEAACEQATRMFMVSNPRTERSAVVCSDNSPTAIWQFVRLITSGNNERRKLFPSPAEAAQWLGEVLTPEERARLEEFLDEPSSPAPFAELPRAARSRAGQRRERKGR